jgi:hypothetical protein
MSPLTREFCHIYQYLFATFIGMFLLYLLVGATGKLCGNTDYRLSLQDELLIHSSIILGEECMPSAFSIFRRNHYDFEC